MIDKVNHHTKKGYDNSKYLIALLQMAQTNPEVFPETISEEELLKVKSNINNYPDWYVGLVGYCSTFANKFMAGFGRSAGRDQSAESIRNILRQDLSNIELYHADYLSIDIGKGNIVYCDPPYLNKNYYGTPFDHEQFHDWLRKISIDNCVLVSEYTMPSDFKCLWQKVVPATMSKNSSNSYNYKVEKLWTLK